MTLLIFSVAIIFILVLCLFAFKPLWQSSSSLQKRIDDLEQRQQLMTLQTTKVFQRRLQEAMPHQNISQLDVQQLNQFELSLLDNLPTNTDIPNHISPLNKSHKILACFLILLFAALSALYLGGFHRMTHLNYWTNVQMYKHEVGRFLNGDTPSLESANDKNGVALIQTMQTLAYRDPTNDTLWLNLAQVFLNLESPKEFYDIVNRSRNGLNSKAAELMLIQYELENPDNTINPEVQDILQAKITTEPDNETFRMFHAMYAVKSKQYDIAINSLQTLQQMRQSSGQNTETSELLDKIIQDVTQKQAVFNNSLITANINISDQLAMRLQESDQLFVVIKSPNEPMPYAVAKLNAMELKAGNVTVKLSDQSSMVADRTISQARANNIPLEISARVSKTGNPIGQVGDFQSRSMVLTDSKTPYQLTIDTQRN